MKQVWKNGPPRESKSRHEANEIAIWRHRNQFVPQVVIRLRKDLYLTQDASAPMPQDRFAVRCAVYQGKTPQQVTEFQTRGDKKREKVKLEIL